MNARTPEQPVDCYLISHYPTHLIDIRKLRDGRRLTLRPVLPQDDRLLADLINGLSENSRNQRFPNARQPASAHEVAALTCVDYGRHLALVVAIQEGGRERLIAEARYLVDEDGQAEVALVVDDAWQRGGIGTWAMLTLSRAAADADVGWLQGDVLADNHAMLALMRRCRFCCTVDRIDARVVHVETRPRALNAHRATRVDRPLGWVRRWLGTSPTAITQY